VVIVQSVAPERVERFRRTVGRSDWPIVADPDGQIAATYGVAEQLYGVLEWVNRPACFVIDAQGVLRWRYLGRSLTDRPDLRDVLREIDRL
jgi:alkyl hydroperoxide reductase subunit AhpC